VKHEKARAKEKAKSSNEDMVRIRLLFVDQGSYHEEEIQVPAGLLPGYERLIDLLREDPHVLKRLHVDLPRLCSAQVVEEGEAGG
jgi:hypothetical protein